LPVDRAGRRRSLSALHPAIADTASVHAMVGLLRLLIVAALLGLVAKLIAKAKQSAEPTAPPDWPTWSDRHGNSGSTKAERSQTEPVSTDGDTNVEAQPPAETAENAKTWLEAIDGECPIGYAVKVKESSGIYHVAGMRNYDRTQPDRCYPTTEAAEADGFRASKV